MNKTKEEGVVKMEDKDGKKHRWADLKKVCRASNQQSRFFLPEEMRFPHCHITRHKHYKWHMVGGRHWNRFCIGAQGLQIKTLDFGDL